MQLVLADTYSEIFLLVNGLVLVFYIAARKKKKQRAMKFGNYSTLQKVAGKNFLKSSNIVLLVKMLALTFVILGLSQPVLQQEGISTDSDYVLAIDSSGSMLSGDIEPDRLRAARNVAQQFISQTSNSTRVGVVSFSGSVEEESGLTADRSISRDAVDNISIGEQGGTAIGDALYTSTSIVMDSEKERTVILLTDGIKTVGGAVNRSVDFAVDNNVTVHTIGLGTRRNISETGDSNSSRAEFPELDTKQLSYISNTTGGNFTTATGRDELERRFLRFERSTVERDLSSQFILIGVILFLLEWMLGTTRYSILP